MSSVASPSPGPLPQPQDSAARREVLLEHLSPAAAEAWLGLARPAVHFRPAGAGDHPLGQVGGAPRLPEEEVWPVGHNGENLPFLLELDLGALAAAGLAQDIGLPEYGLLLVFAKTEASREPFYNVFPQDPAEAVDQARQDARLVHVPVAAGQRRVAPVGTPVYDSYPISGSRVLTLPTPDQPELRAALPADPAERPDAATLWAAADALREVQPGPPLHQLGGWSRVLQNEAEVQWPNNTGETGPWQLLLQVDYDPAAGWNFHDVGTLYFLAEHAVPLDLSRLGVVLHHG